jgi:hypothetical protein
MTTEAKFVELFVALATKKAEYRAQHVKQYHPVTGYNGRYAKKANKLWKEIQKLEKEFLKASLAHAKEKTKNAK